MRTDEVVLAADTPRELHAEIQARGLRNVATMRAPREDVVEVAFAEVELRLHAPETEEIIPWRTDVGFVPRWQAPFPIVGGEM